MSDLKDFYKMCGILEAFGVEDIDEPFDVFVQHELQRRIDSLKNLHGPDLWDAIGVMCPSGLDIIGKRFSWEEEVLKWAAIDTGKGIIYPERSEGWFPGHRFDLAKKRPVQDLSASRKDQSP
jgi:hypothetical protein